MTGTKVTWAQASARRLLRSGLAGPGVGGPGSSPAGVVETMTAVHAQVMSAAELSIALRRPGLTASDVRDALWETRTLVKAHGPRGTIHLLSSRELAVWVGALSAIPVPPHRFTRPDVRLTAEQTEAVVAAAADALADGVELTIEELDEAVGERTGTWAVEPVIPAFQTFWPRWRQALALAGHRGALCFGPNRGRKVTYTSPRRWLSGLPPVSTDEALESTVLRYLAAYGPATAPQFAKWIGAPSPWAADVFTGLAARGKLHEVEFEGTPAWAARNDTAFPDEPPSGVRLLPYFDSYAIAGQPRSLLFPGRAGERALNGGQAGNRPVLLVDGVVAGIWHLRRSGKKAEMTVEAFGELRSGRLEELDEQAERVGEIIGASVGLTLGPVTAGPHA